MTDRKKLIAVLNEIENDVGFICDACGESKKSICIENFADRLLAHGVYVREPQKPMTVEELEPEIVCWYEERNDNPHPVEIGGITSFIQLYFIGGDCPLEEKKWEYGKTWRCWAEKPTKEERENTKWES